MMNPDYIKRQRGKIPSRQPDFLYFGFLKPTNHDYSENYDKARRALRQYEISAQGLRIKLR